PSSPILFPSAMQCLDALGIAEADYADPNAKMNGIKFDLGDFFSSKMPMPTMSCGRNYFCGIERTTFDELLWKSLERFPCVERRQDFTVTDVLQEEGRVIGITGRARNYAAMSHEETITAHCVIGADGRYSLVARRVDAEFQETCNDHTSTVYFADWQGVNFDEPGDPWAHIYTNARGLDIISFAMPNNCYSINTHARSDRAQIGGNAERYYHHTLRSQPRIWRLLERAECVSRVYGLKKVCNGYRRMSGPGWALCGDAVHHKDPIDGQGIYDALLSTQLLDLALASALSGKLSWQDAMSNYERDLQHATQPMFISTMGRLKRELYGEPPIAVVKTLIRWRLSDPNYHEAFLRVLSRELAPAILDSPWHIAASVGRGIGRDLASFFRHR
ncbi:MAG TPA: hypothetical protein ENJ18_14065, partial [Nannocystis exedens]|nr:hypothetical protein [Nannocystis exedens]